jgi:hypothetical protein
MSGCLAVCLSYVKGAKMAKRGDYFRTVPALSCSSFCLVVADAYGGVITPRFMFSIMWSIMIKGETGNAFV